MAPQLRIVIVEDNYDANVALSRLLERFGYEVAGRAYDGLSGLNMIKATHPDVAILDLAMPSLDGLGLAQRVCREVTGMPGSTAAAQACRLNLLRARTRKRSGQRRLRFLLLQAGG